MEKRSNYLYGCLGEIQGAAEHTTTTSNLHYNFGPQAHSEEYLTEGDITYIYEKLMFEAGILITHKKYKHANGQQVIFIVFPRKKAIKSGNWAYAVIPKEKAKLRSREVMAI